MEPRSLPTAALAGLLLLVGSAQTARGQEGSPPQEPTGQEPAPGRDARPPVTRELILRRLEAIERAAERLQELNDAGEARALADRIRWLARDLREQLDVDRGQEPAAGAPTATDAQPDAAALEPVEVSGERARPERWRPVRTREVVHSSWGTNPEVSSQASGSRLFQGQHHLAPAPGGAVMATLYHLHRGYTFRDCIFEGAPGPDGRVTTRWGIRAYDVVDWNFLHCEWRNIPDEHGCYLSAPGSVLWRRCRFEGMGSQAIQVVYRWEPPAAHETSDPRLRELGGLQHVDECIFLECGKPTGGRPAYALSFFGGPRCDVRIEKSYIQTLESQHLDHLGQPSSSYGAIMVHDRPRVELLDTYVHYRRPDRSVIQIWNVEEVVIQGCEVVEGTIEIRNCGKVRIVGNTGAARVVVGTGPGYVWPLPHVRYEGPLSRDYQD